MTVPRDPRRLGSIAFVMSFASMTAELVLAQLTTILYGGAVVRYSMTVGLFIFGLGMGAASWAFLGRRADLVLLAWIEVGLAFAVIAAPFAVLGADPALQALGRGAAGIVAGLFAALIGWLAGVELPVLMDLVQAEGSAEAGGIRARRVIALDFFGSVLATLAMPLVLYPTIGLVGVAALAAAANAALGMLAALAAGRRGRPATLLALLAGAVALAVFFGRESLTAALAARIF